MGEGGSSWGRRIGAFVLAVAVCALWGSLVQTQFNLGALTRLGVDIPLPVRLQSTWHDLYAFSPLYAGICLVGLLPAFAVAGWLAQGHAPQRTALFTAAGAAAVWSALQSANLLAGLVVLVFAARTPLGLASLMLGGAVAGWCYARITRSGRPE